MNGPVVKSRKNASWTLTQSGFEKFLTWLDDGKDSGGQTYLEMRRRLVAYFDRKGCLEPDDLADETLNRVSRRLEEEGTIVTETPAKYCYTVARYVFLESLRANRARDVEIDENHPDLISTGNKQAEERDEREKLLNCLDDCCNKLEPQNRDIIMRYYYGKERVKIENRRALAESLDISMNALTLRACRIRERLEVCVNKCAREE